MAIRGTADPTDQDDADEGPIIPIREASEWADSIIGENSVDVQCASNSEETELDEI